MSSREVYSCVVCKTNIYNRWICRGNNWLCEKCSKIPVAVFYDNNTVAVSIVGGPANNQNMIAPRSILSTGYRVAVQDHPYNSEYHYVDYIFDWNLGLLVLEKEIKVNKMTNNKKPVCPICGKSHPVCDTTTCENPTECHTDRPGVPYLHCRECDIIIRGDR